MSRKPSTSALSNIESAGTGIDVGLAIDDDVAVESNRSGLLQALINIIVNAVEACDGLHAARCADHRRRSRMATRTSSSMVVRQRMRHGRGDAEGLRPALQHAASPMAWASAFRSRRRSSRWITEAHCRSRAGLVMGTTVDDHVADRAGDSGEMSSMSRASRCPHRRGRARDGRRDRGLLRVFRPRPHACRDAGRMPRRCLEQGGFCYVLLDLQIKADSQSIKPRVESGMSVLREIRRRFPQRCSARHAPDAVLVISGHGGTEQHHRRLPGRHRRLHPQAAELRRAGHQWQDPSLPGAGRPQ